MDDLQKVYTGVGARNTPDSFLNEFKYIGEILADRGMLLRSGGAKGADRAFEIGCLNSSANNNRGGDRNIFLPWKDFNHNKSARTYIPDEAYDLAKCYYKNWTSINASTKKLLARDCLQVLGLKPISEPDPSDFLICWTKNGEIVGGTGLAMKIAKDNFIPIYNFALKEDRNKFYEDFNITPYMKYCKDFYKNIGIDIENVKNITNINFQIYTSFFYNQKNAERFYDFIPVSIVMKPPYDFDGIPFSYLAPKYETSIDFTKMKIINYNEFSTRFKNETLDKLDPDDIIEKLKDISKKNDNRNICLFSYEGRNNPSHRSLVADWMNNHFITLKVKEI